MDVDEILSEIGEFGKYQKMLLFLVFVPCMFPFSFTINSQLLMISSPPQCCNPNSNENISGCTNGYETWSSGDSGEDFMICESNFHYTLFLILIGVITMVGSFIPALVENRFGRKRSYFMFLAIMIISGIGTALAVNYWMWILSRLISQLTMPLLVCVPYLLSVEMVGPNYRTDMAMYLNVAISVGLVLVSYLASLFRNWRITAWISTIPFIFWFFLWKYMSESPRWYLAQGRLDDAIQILRKMADVNGRKLTEEHLGRLQENFTHTRNNKSEDDSPQYTMKDLFVQGSLRKITFFVAVSSISCCAVNSGLFYYIFLLGGDRFTNFAFSGLVQLPAYIIPWPFMKRFGRRGFICYSMIISGVACILTQVFKDNIVILALFFVGIMGSSLSMLVFSLFVAELYPTPVRASGMYFSSTVGAVGSTLVPLVNHLGFSSSLPLMIMGVISIIGGCSSFLLRETKDKHLQEHVIEDNKPV